jgi:energy-coupling factor transport system ATP-binding protein
MTQGTTQSELVELRNATFRYKTAELPSLLDINLEIPRGQLTAILGPTNAGKTTLCLMLSGLVPHLVSGELTGTVIVAGEDSLELGQERVAELTRHVGSVFQNPESQLFGLTVEEDIAFGPENLLVPAPEIRTIITDVLAQVGLSGLEKRSPYRLSGGQKQRVAIAAALALRPDLLALDEPVSELDPVGKSEVLAIVSALNEQNQTTIVVADHDPEWVLEMADSVVVIAEGRIIASGVPGDVFAEPASLREHGLHLPDAVELTDRLAHAGSLERAYTTEAGAVAAIRTAIDSNAISLGPLPTAPYANTSAPPPSERIAISVSGVGFAYPGAPAVLHDVSVSIPENDYIALVGHNGSGKTTLAKQFNGILKPTSGTITLEGVDASTLSLSTAARRVGYVYQNPDHQIFARTVYDEVAFGPRNLGITGDELSAAVTEALEFVGLAGDEKKEPFFLGLGQRQRLAVASVLAMRPEILVVDEPDTGQDAKGAREMMELIDRLHADGKTIVMITHTMEIVARHAHRVVAMAGGRIVFDAPTREFFASPEMLAELSMRAPQVTRMCAALGSDVPILTIDEAATWLGA